MFIFEIFKKKCLGKLKPLRDSTKTENDKLKKKIAKLEAQIDMGRKELQRFKTLLFEARKQNDPETTPS